MSELSSPHITLAVLDLLHYIYDDTHHSRQHTRLKNDCKKRRPAKVNLRKIVGSWPKTALAADVKKRKRKQFVIFVICFESGGHSVTD
jgi:predicted metal-dependent hydrolase